MTNLIPYLKYFFYLGTNWNWRLAVVLILQEIKGEKKYGINTTGADELNDLADTGVDISNATIYMPISYPLLENVLTLIPENAKNHFLDIGCGKGRALCIAAYHGFKKISGVDFSATFCADAIENLQRITTKKNGFQQCIVHENILHYQIPADVDCLFLFNPFDEKLVLHLVNDIKRSLQINPRSMYIIYANPLYIQLFFNEGFEQIFHAKKMKYFEVSIMTINT